MTAIVRLPAPEKRSAAELVSYESEQALLGAILIDNAVMAKVGGWLRAEHFADALHGRIFDACRKLIDRGNRADWITLKALFDADDALKTVGGGKHLFDLAGAAITTEFADDYGRTIVDLARKRAVLRLAEDMTEAAFDPSIEADALVAETATKLHALADPTTTGGGTARELALEVVAAAERAPTMFSTGIAGLDRAMGGGLTPGCAYGIRAPTKAGKTVMAGTIAFNLNTAGIPSLYLAYEMRPRQLARRNLARQLGVNGLALLPGASVALLTRATAAAMDTPSHAHYEPMAGRTLADALRAISGHVVRHGIRGVFVDYIQLIRGQEKGESRADFLERAAYEMVALCARLDIWCVLLAQVNREGETRGGDGLNFAVDQLYTLCRQDPEEEAALRMELTRDTPYCSVGTVDPEGRVTKAGLIFHKNGPWFEDAGQDPQEEML